MRAQITKLKGAKRSRTQTRGSKATDNASAKHKGHGNKATVIAGVKHKARGSEATQNASTKPEGAKRQSSPAGLA